MKKMSQPASILMGGVPKELKEASIDVFLEGFGRKVDHLMLKPKNRAQAKRVYLDGADFTSALYAVSEGSVLGILGFQYRRKKFINLNLGTLKDEFGLFGGAVRKLSGSVFKDLHPLKGDELRVQVISVSEGARGRGVGHQLLEALFAYGRARQCTGVRLEVVNTNPHAKKLYETMGFKTCGFLPYGPIAAKAGFSSQYRMKKAL